MLVDRPEDRPVAAEAAAAPQLLWQSLPAAAELTGYVDRVELKALVDGHLEAAMAVLDTRIDDLQLRQVYYLDTPDLTLHGHGIVVRLRIIDEARADVVVKLRRAAPPTRRRWHRGLPVELDALPATASWSAALRRRIAPAAATTALRKRRPAKWLLSKPQRALLRATAPPDLDVDDLLVLGPATVVHLASGQPGNRIVVQSWAYPDGSSIVELSAKCLPARFPQVAAAVRHLIAEHAVPVAEQQLTKTQLSLQRLAGRGPQD
jgi:hypothetical protein